MHVVSTCAGGSSPDLYWLPSNACPSSNEFKNDPLGGMVQVRSASALPPSAAGLPACPAQRAGRAQFLNLSLRLPPAAARRCDHPQGRPPAAALPVRRQLHLHKQRRARVSELGRRLPVGLLQQCCGWGLQGPQRLWAVVPRIAAGARVEQRRCRSAPALLACSCKAGLFEVVVVARSPRCAPAGDPGDCSDDACLD